MNFSNATTLPLIAIVTSMSLSTIASPQLQRNSTLPVGAPQISLYQTTSSNRIAEEYVFNFEEENPRLLALQLYGEQSNYTQDERITYKAMLSQKSQEVGINIFDLF